MTVFGRMHRTASTTPSVTFWVAAGLGALSLLLAHASLRLAR